MMAIFSGVSRRIRTTGNNLAVDVKHGSRPYWDTRRVRSSVGDEESLSFSAVYRGITLIASTIASLPIHVYEENADGQGEKLKNPELSYLWLRPNSEMTRQTFWEKIYADEGRGNAYIFVVKDRIGRVAMEGPFWGIWPIERWRVQVGRDPSTNRKVYLIDGEVACVDYKDGGEIIHISNWGDGLIGYDPIQLMAQAVALGLDAEDYASEAFEGGQVPPGLISTDQKLTPEQARDTATLWRLQHQGKDHWSDVAVLGNGAKYQETSRSLEAMQMENTRRFQVTEVARMLGIPPHMLGEVTTSTSWGTGIEEQTRGFVTFTLGAHIKRGENAVDDALLVREMTGRYMRHELGGLLRGTTLQRMQALRMADFMTPDEKRALEELPPLPDDAGKTIYVLSTMVPIGEAGATLASGGDPNAEGGESGSSDAN